MLDQERLISLCGEATDVPKLLWIPDYGGALCPIEERQSRGDVTLARLVNHDEIEFGSYKGNSTSRRKGCNGPARQCLRGLGGEIVISPPNLSSNGSALII